MSKGATLDFLAQDAAYFQEILDASGVGLWEHDARSGQSLWSTHIFRLLGRPEGELPAGADGWLTLVHPDDLPSVRARMAAALAPDNPLYLAEFRMQHSDGRWLWVQARGRVIERDANGHVRRTAGTLCDITAKKELDSRQQHSEERLRLITESITEVFWLADVSLDTMFYVSPAYERIWQRPARELYARPRSFLEAIHPDDRDGVLAELERQSQSLPLDHEYRIVRPDGSIRWIWDRGFPIGEPQGPVTRYAGLAQDITERKQAETEIHRLNADLETRVAQRTAELEAITRELQDSQERFRFAMESSHIGVWEWHLLTGAVHYSAVLTERLGCDPAELARDPMGTWQNLLHPDDRAIAAATGSQLRESGRVEQEFRLRAKDGSHFWVLSRGQVVERDPTGAPLRVIGIHADIDARKRAEALNRRLAAIIEASSDLIGTATPEGVIDYMNRAGRAWLGIGAHESLEHARIQDYHPAWDYRRVMEESFPTALAEGEWMGDTTMRRRDGSEFPVSQLILGHRDPATGGVEFMSTICRDLSGRLAAELALRRLQEEQALILDRAPALIWYKDTENRILRVNAAASESLGLPKDRIEGHRVAEFYPEDADRYYQDDLAVIRSGQPRLGIEEPYRLPSGEQRWLQTDKVPLTDEDGQVTRLLVMSMDITERKEAEIELERMRDQLAEGQRIAHLGSWEYITATQTTAWSDEQKRIYGLDPAQPSPDYQTMLRHHIHPDDAPELDRCFRTALENRARFEHENRIVRPDGTIRWIYNQAQPYFDDTGQLLRYVGATLDITARKQAEETLSEQQALLQSILDHTPALIFIKDLEQRYLIINRRCEQILGVPSREILGKTAHDFLPEALADQFAANDRAVIASGQSQQVEETIPEADGPHIYASTQFPLLDGQGRLTAICGISTDITDRKRAEAILKDADRQKDEFLATLAHELRNPLAPLSNGLTILHRSRDNPAAAASVLAMMERQLQHMVRLIDDLLDLSRISQGKIELQKSWVELTTIVQHAVETSRPLIHQAGLELRLNFPAEPIRVEADLTRLAQAIANLLNNAAKYTNPGGCITLTVERQGRQALVRVKDTGMGIPPAMLGRVFDLFTQMDHSLEKSQGGLGIGLSLVKRLAELHGGSVEAHSQGCGLGSEFIIRLPICDVSGVGNETSAFLEGNASTTASRRILVADDNTDAAASLSLLLEMMGHDVRTARDGQEAIEMASDFRPELILLDLGMPRLNGYDACRRIRAESWGRSIWIAALTGWGQDRDKHESQAAGFNHHFVKPVDLAELERLLKALPASNLESQRG